MQAAPAQFLDECFFFVHRSPQLGILFFQTKLGFVASFQREASCSSSSATSCRSSLFSVRKLQRSRLDRPWPANHPPVPCPPGSARLAPREGFPRCAARDPGGDAGGSGRDSAACVTSISCCHARLLPIHIIRSIREEGIVGVNSPQRTLDSVAHTQESRPGREPSTK